MDKIGTHGCFFCGASIVIGETQKSENRITYVCTGCGKAVVVTVVTKSENGKKKR